MKVLRLTSYIWAIACVGSIAVLFFLYRLMKKKRAFLQERLLNQISRLRMENIRNHVSPHFTFNVLNREISRFKGTDRERSGLVDLVKLYRREYQLFADVDITKIRLAYSGERQNPQHSKSSPIMPCLSSVCG